MRASIKEESQRTTTLTDNKRETTKTKDLQCMMTHALASTALNLFQIMGNNKMVSLVLEFSHIDGNEIVPS